LINSIKISGLKAKTLVLVALTFIILSCNRKIDTIKKSDIDSLPTLTEMGIETVYTDSAKLQLVMSSPLIERYTNKEPPYSEFRNGIKVLFHDGHIDPVARLTAKYAKLNEDTQIWELRDSVIAVNEKNEILETELLYWDQEKELVYTDRFVKITGEDQIVMGTGLKSNPRFTSWFIRNVTASFYIKDEK
jgi:LPS export ABC transporter protein LptC